MAFLIANSSGNNPRPEFMRIGVQEFGGHVGRGGAVSQNYHL